jgi:uncharacterized protein
VFRFSAILLLAGLCVSCGTKQRSMNSAQVRGITRELVFAAKNASNGEAHTGMMPELLPARFGTARGQAPPQVPSADMIFISLPEEGGKTNQAVLDAIDSELERVARSHDLVRVARQGAPGVVRFDFTYGGQRTHSIHIVTPLLAHQPAEFQRVAEKSEPKLAIIIDDVGYDRAAADRLLQMPFALTLSVLPHLPHSAEIAEEAFRRGYEVMLHLPIESASGEKAEAVELDPGMPAERVVRSMQEMLETVPHAVGVNNHQGSLGTSDSALMNEVMPALHERDLFFVDSRTTSKSRAFDAARRAHVPAAARDVFLDDEEDAGAIRRQLDAAVRDAKAHGSAVAIGHPHAGTLQVLSEMAPEIAREGIELVFASQVVK